MEQMDIAPIQPVRATYNKFAISNLQLEEHCLAVADMESGIQFRHTMGEAQTLLFLKGLFPELFMHIAEEQPWIDDITEDTHDDELEEEDLPYVMLAVDRNAFRLLMARPTGEKLNEFKGKRGKSFRDSVIWLSMSFCYVSKEYGICNSHNVFSTS